MADGDPTECPKCKGKNFVIYEQVLYPDRKTIGRVLECRDCNKAAFEKAIAEYPPEVLKRYSKTKIRPEYYGTVTIKDLIKDEE